jgi:predicted RNase H-like HicB family nuclease
MDRYPDESRAGEYLAQPYARLILPESDGTFRGEIVEFPGCIASGDTAAETLTNLEDAAKGWLMAALENGQNIPRPVESSNDFSGKLVLRLPRSLHKKATWVAEREGVSLNQFIVASLAEAVGERSAMNISVSIYPINQLRPISKFSSSWTLFSSSVAGSAGTIVSSVSGRSNLLLPVQSDA